MARFPVVLPDKSPPPRPPGEIPNMEVPGLDIKYSYDPNQTFGRSATARAQPFSAIVSHYTGGNSLESALSTSKGDPARGGSPYGYHFYIDKDGTVYQGAPLTARTNHVMPPNSQYRSDRPDISNNNAIGISMVGTNNKPTPEQVASGQKLVTALQQRYPAIINDNIVGHGQIQARGKDSREPDEGMALVNAARTGKAPTQTAAATPPGKPLSQTLTGGKATPDEAFSLAPTEQRPSSIAASPAQQAITAATTPKEPPPQFSTMAPTSNPLPPGIPVTGSTWRERSKNPARTDELPPQAVLSNAPGMVPLPRERPAAAGPNANAVAAEDKAYGRGAPAAAPTATAAAPAAAPQQAPQQAPAAQPQRAQAPAAAPGGKSLGQRIIESYGPRGQNLRAIVDPATGHEIVTGSVDGENINRDIGPLSRQTPAQSAPAQRPASPARGAPPTGPVPPAPDNAGVLTKPDAMPSPGQTLDTLDRMRTNKSLGGNTLTDLYKSDNAPPSFPSTPNTASPLYQPQPKQPAATFRDIANAGPGYFKPPGGTTLQGMGVPPYNVGGPGGTPMPPPRPTPGRDLGAPVARLNLGQPPQGYAGSLSAGQPSVAGPNFLDPTGPSATGPEAETRQLAQTAEANRAPQPFSPLTFDEAQRMGSALAAALVPPPPRGADRYGQPSTPRTDYRPQGKPGYDPGFLNPSAASATPAEQATKNIAVAAEAGRGGGIGRDLANAVQQGPVNMRTQSPEAQMPWSPIQLPPAAEMAVQPPPSTMMPPSMPVSGDLSALFPQNQPPPPPPQPVVQQPAPGQQASMPLSPFSTQPQNQDDLLQFLMNGMNNNADWQMFNQPFTPG